MRATAQAEAETQRNAEADLRATAQAEAEAQRNSAVQEANLRATAQAVAAERRTLVQALQIAAIGQQEFDRTAKGPFISTVLGIEALQRGAPLFEADQLVRRGLELLPVELSRTIHNDRVVAVAFSPDGRYAVSGSKDREVHI